MNVKSKLIMDQRPDVVPAMDLSCNGGHLRRPLSTSSIHFQDHDPSGSMEVQNTTKDGNNTSLPTSYSCSHISKGVEGCSRFKGIMGSNPAATVCDEESNRLFRGRTGTADGSTQTNNKGRRNRRLDHGLSTSTDSSDTQNTELDGGFWAWIVVLGAFLTNGIIFGVINCFGVMFKQIEDKFSTNQDNSAFLTSCVGSLAIGMTFLCSFIASICTDCFGIRRTAVFGGILATTGMFCSSFATSFTHLYFTYGILFGVGASLSYSPSLVILGHYFSKRLGIVNGVVTAGSSVFTMIMSVSLKALSETNDFETNMRILAALMSLLILCGLTFIEKKKPTTATSSRTGKKCNLQGYSKPAGKSVEDAVKKTSGKYSFPDSDGKCRRMSNSSSSSYSSLETSASFNDCSKTYKVFNTEIWKNKLYVLWSLAIPVALFGYFVPYVHLCNHVRLILPDVNGAILVTTIGASSGLGRLIFGNIADAPGVNRIFLQQIAFLSIGTLTLLLTLTTNLYCLLAICVGLGIFDGCFIAVLGPIAFDLVGKAGAPQAIGFLLAFCSIPLTIGPPVAGKIFDAFKSYKYAFLIAGLPPFVGALMMWPIFKRQRAMALKLVSVEDEEETEAQLKCHNHRQGQSGEGGEDGDDEETSSTGVSPTVITGLSSASPSNILVNQSSSEDQASLNMTDGDIDANAAAGGNGDNGNRSDGRTTTAANDFNQGHVIEGLVQESKDRKTTLNINHRHPEESEGGSMVSDPLIKFN